MFWWPVLTSAECPEEDPLAVEKSADESPVVHVLVVEKSADKSPVVHPLAVEKPADEPPVVAPVRRSEAAVAVAAVTRPPAEAGLLQRGS